MKMPREQFELISNATVRRQIADYCETCDERALFHIGVYALADKWNNTRAQVLNSFLEGVEAGIFRLEWHYHCCSCGGVINEAPTLSGAHATDHCSACNIDTQNTLNKNVEVFFSIHPQMYELPPLYDEEYKKRVTEAVMSDHLFAWKTKNTIYGSDLIQNNIFREILGDDVLLPTQSLVLEKATVLFTDIRGSTQMYTDLGDAKAFNLVNDHFAVLFEIISRNGGVPVKTIGDAVMGVFLKSFGALSTALECQKEMQELNGTRSSGEKIELKIGLHSGTMIVVTLNGRLDYFGTAVNLAARIQSVAQPNEITFSEPVIMQKANIALLKQYTKSIGRSTHVFKGLNGTYPIYHMQFPVTV